MNTQSEIDETLRRLGSVEPAPGLARRVEQRLLLPRRGFFLSLPQAIAAGAVAASMAVSTALFVQPTLRRLVLPHSGTAPVEAPRVVPVAGGFGAASVVHVPAAPVAVQPTPVTQGRGHARSGRTVLPSESQTPLPRGVAAPH